MLIDVYWDSRRQMYSLRDHYERRVIGKAHIVCLENVQFHVSEKARLRCLAKGQKEVHAWVTGTLTAEAGADERPQYPLRRVPPGGGTRLP